MKRTLVLLSALALSGCSAGALEFPDFKGPSFWTKAKTSQPLYQETNAQSLQGWWYSFNDPLMDALIAKALADNPDRRAAKALVLEARGLKRSTRSDLFPDIGALADTGREDTAQSRVDDYYDARFDASYEVDIFGRNRSRVSAAAAALESLEAQYQDETLTLVAEVARTYIEARANEKQTRIAQENLETQIQTLDLIRKRRDVGENPQLDVERAENQVNTTRASIPEFKRLSENAWLRLSVLTGTLPEGLTGISETHRAIPGGDVTPVLMSPAKVLALRPDIRAAAANLRAKSKLSETTIANIFPIFTLSGFYGVAENSFTNATNIWNVAIGAAVSLLDFGRLKGEVAAARAREMEAYELYRKTVLEAVVELETALNDYAHINEQTVLLHQAYKNAQNALNLSRQLFTEGEIAFLDVLEAQRSVNDAQSALTNAEAAKASALIRLYKSLGVGPQEK